MRPPSQEEVNSIAEHIEDFSVVSHGDEWLCVGCGESIAPQSMAYECSHCQQKPFHDVCLVEHLRQEHQQAEVPLFKHSDATVEDIFPSAEKALEHLS